MRMCCRVHVVDVVVREVRPGGNVGCVEVPCVQRSRQSCDADL